MRLTKAQLAYRRSKALYRGLVGGIGSGKSFIGSFDLIRRAKPGRFYMAVGPTYVMLKDASLRSFLDHVRALNYLKDFRRSDMTAVLGNGAEVIFRTAEDPDRLRGPNLSGVWLDEASLMRREVFDIAIGRLREEGEQGWLGATFTPKGRHHWTYQVFASGGPDTAIFRSPTTDNPFLPSAFADTIRRQYPDVMARQELEGEFIEDGLGYLFPDEWLNRAERLADGLMGKPRKARALGCDPAEGGDSSAWAIIDELGLIELLSMKTEDTNVIPSTTLMLMRKYGIPADTVVFDRGGGGKEHADRLRAMGHAVRTVAFGESVTPEPRRGHARIAERMGQREERYAYFNRRAALYGELRELLDPERNPTGFAIPGRYTELRRQLAPIPLTYDLEGRLKILPKNKRGAGGNGQSLTELIGHSPDEADSLALAIFAMKHREKRAMAGAV